jgi:VanZ family protein
MTPQSDSLRQRSGANQPDFLSWCEERKIQLIHIQPGRPMQNGHVESFNGRLAAMGVVVLGSLSPANSFLMRTVASIHIWDKILHFVAYVFLAIFPVLGMRRTLDALVGVGSMMVLGLLMEITQHFVPGRSLEVADEVANMLGVLCGMAIAFPFRAQQCDLSGSNLK